MTGSGSPETLVMNAIFFKRLLEAQARPFRSITRVAWMRVEFEG